MNERAAAREKWVDDVKVMEFFLYPNKFIKKQEHI